MKKKKRIKKLQKENAKLRERLKYFKGYYEAARVIAKTYEETKNTPEGTWRYL